MSTRPFAFALVLLAAPTLARAEDPAAGAPKPTPAERTAKVRAALAAPDAKDGFRYEMDVSAGDAPLGTLVVVAEPGTKDGKPAWVVSQELVIDIEGQPKQVHALNATLAQDLRILALDSRIGDGEKTSESSKVTPAEKGFRVEKTKGEGKSDAVVEAPASTTCSLPGVLLLYRRLPAEPGAYEATIWDTSKATTTSSSIEVKGAAKLEFGDLKADAWLLTSTRADDTIDAFFDPKDRSLLATHSLKKGFWVVRKGLAKPKPAEPPPDLSKPPESAKGAGILFAMGILTGDLEAIGRSIHWPSFHAAGQEQGYPGDEASFKEMVLEMVKPNLKEMKADKAWPVVKGAANGASETAGEKGTHVKLGAPMGVAYTAKEIDGRWWIVAMDPPGADGGK